MASLLAGGAGIVARMSPDPVSSSPERVAFAGRPRWILPDPDSALTDVPSANRAHRASMSPEPVSNVAGPASPPAVMFPEPALASKRAQPPEKFTSPEPVWILAEAAGAVSLAVTSPRARLRREDLQATFQAHVPRTRITSQVVVSQVPLHLDVSRARVQIQIHSRRHADDNGTREEFKNPMLRECWDRQRRRSVLPSSE